jgi:hypothetical protein
VSDDPFSQLFDFQCAILYIGTKLARLASMSEGDREDQVKVDQVIQEAMGQARLCLATNTAALESDDGTGTGFTAGCLECWVEAVVCTPEQCVTYDEATEIVPIGGPCKPLLDAFLSPDFDPANPVFPPDFEAAFGACLLCDVVTCTPPFVECAGATRRTIGRDSPALTTITAILGQKLCTEAFEDNACEI